MPASKTTPTTRKLGHGKGSVYWIIRMIDDLNERLTKVEKELAR